MRYKGGSGTRCELRIRHSLSCQQRAQDLQDALVVNHPLNSQQLFLIPVLMSFADANGDIEVLQDEDNLQDVPLETIEKPGDKLEMKHADTSCEETDLVFVDICADSLAFVRGTWPLRTTISELVARGKQHVFVGGVQLIQENRGAPLMCCMDCSPPGSVSTTIQNMQPVVLIEAIEVRSAKQWCFRRGSHNIGSFHV